MSVTRPSTTRERSPCAALREAKLRLRKLEIEAAAVERSYMDFRRRRERRAAGPDDSNLLQSVNTEKPQTESKPENSQPQISRSAMKTDLEKFLTRYQNDFDIGQTHFKNKNTAAEIRNPIPEVFSEVNRDMHAKLDYLAKPLPEFRKLYYSQSDRNDAEELPAFEEGSHDSSHDSGEFKDKLSEIEKKTHKKEKELKLLEQNLSKIYDLQDEPTKESEEPLNIERDTRDTNLLRVEIETTENENDVILVASSVDSRAMSKETMSAQMTIIVSPKVIEGEEVEARSPSPEKEAHLTRKDVFNAIFDAAKDSSSNDMRLETINDQEQDSVNDNEQDDYGDDFSADVDNYNSKADTDNEINSPVSLPKTSEDDFWD